MTPTRPEALRALLEARRTAALGTVGAQGRPFVSMVPFAVDPVDRTLVLHVSELAAHTGHMHAQPGVSLLVQREENAGEPVHALARVTFVAEAEFPLPESPAWIACRAAYLARFPEAEPMTALGDFRFVALHPSAARLITGFAAAVDMDPAEIDEALGRQLDARQARHARQEGPA